MTVTAVSNTQYSPFAVALLLFLTDRAGQRIMAPAVSSLPQSPMTFTDGGSSRTAQSIIPWQMDLHTPSSAKLAMIELTGPLSAPTVVTATASCSKMTPRAFCSNLQHNIGEMTCGKEWSEGFRHLVRQCVQGLLYFFTEN